ncbi:TPA: DUF7694 domain-containing protein [Citrobacter amalonaticus]
MRYRTKSCLFVSGLRNCTSTPSYPPGSVIRLTVNTTSIASSGRWKDGISWDALQEIKSAVGYGDRDAVEIYPRDSDVVNVANMRHLWITPEPISFAWRK